MEEGIYKKFYNQFLAIWYLFSVYLCPETAEAARLASGAAVDLVAGVLSGQLHNALGLVRPPGHHAMEDELNG